MRRIWKKMRRKRRRRRRRRRSRHRKRRRRRRRNKEKRGEGAGGRVGDMFQLHFILLVSKVSILFLCILPKLC
jgi:hypothetical protein